ncbi:CHAD domain-containing protein [Roseiconus nitratireducens]|uniref:CHAD domain-containing protein n=1 Tax=Roseiconus nitratireducens TaxID=2605748 RepID=A0A5M6D7V7_9BACT|nr:CHAD domain-containing protein [Roseiconus nitratireducens]KAA5542570.1 CHAD domain-containing protein [Roseiconus nitratireducens]
MAFRIKRGESSQDALRRIACEQIDKGIAEVDDDELNVHDTVHQVRKRCKKLRGLLRLFRPSLGKIYDQENVTFRDAARSLSAIRDAASVLGTYDGLLDHYASQVHRPAFASIRRTLTSQLRELDEQETEQRLKAFRAIFVETRQRAASWKLDDHGFQAIRGGLKKTYGRARDRLDDVRDDPTVEQLHQLRKRCKYHWYHIRLLKPVWPAMLSRHASQLSDLADLLGDDHDLAIFRGMVSSDPETFGSAEDIQALNGLIDQRRKRLQRQAIPLAGRLLAETPEQLADRLATYWKISRK